MMKQEIEKYSWVELHIWRNIHLYENDPVFKPENRELYKYDEITPDRVEKEIDLLVQGFNRDSRISYLRVKVTPPGDTDTTLKEIEKKRSK